MHEFVYIFRRFRWLLQGPEHRDSQCNRHDERQGYVEVLAHPLVCIGLAEKRQARALDEVF